LSQANLPLTNSASAVAAYDRSPALTSQGGKLAFALLWLFTFVVYARPQDIFPAINPFHLPLVFGACAGLTYLEAMISGQVLFKRPGELVLVLLLTVWFILGVPFAYWRGGSFEVLTQIWLKTAFLFFLLTQMLTTSDRIRKLVWAVVLSELMATTSSIIAQGEEAIQEGTRLVGVNQVMLGWNFLGITAAVIIPYMAALYVSRRSLLRTGLLLATLAATFWMLVLTASRGGFLTVTISIVLTWWFVLRQSPRGRMAGVIITLLLIMAVAKAPDVFWTRVQTIWDNSEASSNSTVISAQESTEERKNLLERSIRYSLEYPIFGVGLGNFQVINGTQLARPNAWLGTHNTFTQISSEAGIPALVLFLLLLCTALRHAKEADRESHGDVTNIELNLMARGTLVSVVSFVFAGFFAHVAYDFFFYYPAGIAAGLWTIVRESAKVPAPSAKSRRMFQAMPSTKWFAKWPLR